MLHNFIEEICLLNNGCYRNEKKDTISGIIATPYPHCKEDKILEKHECYTFNFAFYDYFPQFCF